MASTEVVGREVGLLLLDGRGGIVGCNAWILSQPGLSGLPGRTLAEPRQALPDHPLIDALLRLLARDDGQVPPQPLSLPSRAGQPPRRCLLRLEPLDPVISYRVALLSPLDGNGVREADGRGQWRSGSILAAITDALVITDRKGRVDYLNASAERLAGTPLESVRGRTLQQLLDACSVEGRVPLMEIVEQAMNHGEVTQMRHELSVRGDDGGRFTVDAAVPPLLDASGQVVGAMVIMRDITTERRLAATVDWQSSHDALTGLINRAAFEKKLESLVRSTREAGGEHALLYLDLDQFKVVNDTSGHLVGDELLRQVAALLAGLVRANDTLARLGGDEFGMLLAGCPVERAQEISAQIRRAIRDYRFVWGGSVFVR
ncbi:MAG: diguanylate cyclase [gamma proteobacterium symbiont of Phacoides pectinatus]